MKEQFRDWTPKGKIKVKYWVDKEKGVYDYWLTTAEELFDHIKKVVEDYIDMDIKLTNRQLFYQLVANGWIPNADEVYKKVCEFLTDCRYAGLIDWDAIEDKDRTPTIPLQFKNIQERIDLAVRNFRLPRWSDQEYYAEMYCEKKAGINVLQPIADAYHITFGFNKGYSSASAMYELAKRMADKVREGKKCRLLYFGDHDSSGLDMVRDIHVRVCEFLTAGDEVMDIVGDDEDNPSFKIEHIALTGPQIRKYNPPPNPAKMSDPRAKWYVKEYGNKSWELDSLNALELRNIAERSVQQFLDVDKFNAWIKREDSEKKSLRDFGNKMGKKK